MAFYFSYQFGSRDTWKLALAEERTRIIKDLAPPLVTVLDADSDFVDGLSFDDKLGVKFHGPFYVDFDGSADELDFVISQFKIYLDKLEKLGVDLNSIYLYATGGRGFHVEIPQLAFLKRVPPTGTAALPKIYKEMAQSLAVETMDFRIYSARRMWRTPGVKRDNGKYKVQIGAAEAKAMTPELYETLCATPRPALNLHPLEYNGELALRFSQAKDKVEAAIRRLKAKKKVKEPLARFKGEWPPTILRLFSGEGFKEGAGWNRIAMQLAVVAVELGRDEDALLEAAEPLLRVYEGDGSRYGTYNRRRREMIDQFRYMDGNPCYEFSLGAVLTLISPSEDVSDLTVEGVVESPADYVDGDGDSAVDAVDDGVEDHSYVAGIRVNKSGIFVKEDEVFRRVSRIGLHNPIKIVGWDRKTIGYEVDIHCDGVFQATDMLVSNLFTSKSEMNKVFAQYGSSIKASDTAVSTLGDFLDIRTVRKGNVMHLVTREGIDIIVPHGSANHDDIDIVWSSPTEVISVKDRKYRFRGEAEAGGTYHSDLWHAPKMTDTPESRELISILLNLNTPDILGKALGWFASTFISQILRHLHNEYPVLQVYGQAGAGKSKLIEILSRLHYYSKAYAPLAASSQTEYVVTTSISQSASMPVVFEEVKAREMDKRKRDHLLNAFRNNYTCSQTKRGAVQKDSGRSEVVTKSYNNSAPLVFIGEAIETQAAVLERCVVVALSKDAITRQRIEGFQKLYPRCHELGTLGRVMVDAALSVNITALQKELQDARAVVMGSVSESMCSDAQRPLHNLAIVMVGLRFLKSTLNHIFGETFDERMDELSGALLTDIEASIPSNLSEASRVLDVLSQLTRVADVQHRLERGVEYSYNPVTRSVDIKLKPSYAKYQRYIRSLGMEPLFDNDIQFISAMNHYAGTTAKICPDNKLLYRNPTEPIYRFSADYLTKEGVEPFEE